MEIAWKQTYYLLMNWYFSLLQVLFSPHPRMRIVSLLNQASPYLNHVFFPKLPNSIVCLVKNTMYQTPSSSGVGVEGVGGKEEPWFLHELSSYIPSTMFPVNHICHCLSRIELFTCLFLHLEEFCWLELREVDLAGSSKLFTFSMDVLVFMSIIDSCLLWYIYFPYPKSLPKS